MRTCLVIALMSLCLTPIGAWATTNPVAVSNDVERFDYLNEPAAPVLPEPLYLSVADDPETIYAPARTPDAWEPASRGGVNFLAEVRYQNRYVFRGIEPFRASGDRKGANLQFDAELSFDLGNAPHPFVGVFTNVRDSDDVSTFQEIRPVFGIDWALEPVTLRVGHNAFIYPNRDELQTSEVFVKLELDDGFIFGVEGHVLRPFVLVAYDYDVYNGWYVEAGVSHRHDLEGTGLSIEGRVFVAYIHGYELLGTAVDDEGFQRWQADLTVMYELNTLLNIPNRYGRWSVVGYISYTDNIEQSLAADTQIWGGVGLRWEY